MTGKILGIILIVVLLIAGGLFVYQHVRSLQSVGVLETIVPGDAIYYFYSYAPSKKITDFYNSDFCQKIVNLSVYQELVAPVLAKQEVVFDQLAGLLDSDTAFAVFSPQLFSMKEMADSESSVETGKFLLFVRTNTGENIKAIIADLFLRASGHPQMKREAYKGVKMSHYAIAEPETAGFKTLSCAQLGDIFVIGNDQQRLKKAIDLFKGSSVKSLANNKVFQALQKQAGSASKEVLLWNAINYKRYYSEIIALMLKRQTETDGGSAAIAATSFEDFIENFMGVMVGLVNVVDYDNTRTGFLVTTHQLFDAAKDEQGFLPTFTIAAKESNPILNMVSADTLGYVGICGDMSRYFSYFKNYFKKFTSSATGLTEVYAPENGSSAASEFGFSGILNMVDAKLGVSFEKDILPLLGQHCSLFLADIEEVTVMPQAEQVSPFQLVPAPVPHLFLIVEAKDAMAARKLQALIINGLGSWQSDRENEVMPRQEMYKDIALQVIPVKDAPFLPVCFVIDRYCVFGSSPELARKIIDTQSNTNKSLAAEFNYQFDEKQLMENSSFTLFFDFKALVAKIAAAKMVEFMKPTVGFFTKGVLTPADVDAVFDVLDDITLIAQANRISAEAVGEGLFYIGAEGL